MRKKIFYFFFICFQIFNSSIISAMQEMEKKEESSNEESSNEEEHNLPDLHQACTDGDHEKIKTSITQENINKCISPYGTPLHLAVYNEHYNIVLDLLKNGANPNIVDAFNAIPLHYALWKGDKKMAIILLEYGSNLSILFTNKLKFKLTTHKTLNEFYSFLEQLLIYFQTTFAYYSKKEILEFAKNIQICTGISLFKMAEACKHEYTLSLFKEERP